MATARCHQVPVDVDPRRSGDEVPRCEVVMSKHFVGSARVTAVVLPARIRRRAECRLRVVVVGDQLRSATESAETLGEFEMIGMYGDAWDEREHLSAVFVESHGPWCRVAGAREV